MSTVLIVQLILLCLPTVQTDSEMKSTEKVISTADDRVPLARMELFVMKMLTVRCDTVSERKQIKVERTPSRLLNHDRQLFLRSTTSRFVFHFRVEYRVNLQKT